MSGTDEGWPSRLLPMPKGWLKAFALSIVLVIAALGAKAAFSAPRRTTASNPPMVDARRPIATSVGASPVVAHEIVALEGLYVRH